MVLVAQDKRKEKARIAARARRSQEADIIMDMASELNITQEKLRRIDKATIVKLAIDYIKAYDILCRIRDQRSSSSSSSSTPSPQHHNSINSISISINSNSTSSTTSNSSNTSNQPLNQSINRQQQCGPLYSAPKLSTTSIFAPKTSDTESLFFLTPDMDDDDLTHLAPSAGESVTMDVEPLDGIVVDASLFAR